MYAINSNNSNNNNNFIQPAPPGEVLGLFSDQ
jgi:hypothetical protein